MSKLTYFLVRMWGPRGECENPRDPRYVARVEDDNGTNIRWTITEEFDEANFFKSVRTARRVVRGVKRVSDRIIRGWLYEIIKVDEEIVDSNIPERKQESA